MIKPTTLLFFLLVGFSQMLLSQDCKENVNISVSSFNGDYTFMPADLLSGSTNFSSIVIDPPNIGCQDIGATIEVSVTVTLGDGSTSSCLSNVTVSDAVPPVAICTSFATVIVPDVPEGESGNPSVSLYAIDLGFSSYDNCSPNVRFTFADTPPSMDPTFDENINTSVEVYEFQEPEWNSSVNVDVQVLVWDDYDNYNSCFVDVTFIVPNGVVSSTSDIESPEVYVYPNPASDRLHINVKHTNDYTFEIYNILGHLINSMKNVNEIDIEHLQKGTYIYMVKSKEGTSSKKFIKE